MTDLLAMDGYAPYVWACYGLGFAVLLCLALISWRSQKHRTARADALRAATPRRRQRTQTDMNMTEGMIAKGDIR